MIYDLAKLRKDQMQACREYENASGENISAARDKFLRISDACVVAQRGIAPQNQSPSFIQRMEETLKPYIKED